MECDGVFWLLVLVHEFDFAERRCGLTGTKETPMKTKQTSETPVDVSCLVRVGSSRASVRLAELVARMTLVVGMPIITAAVKTMSRLVHSREDHDSFVKGERWSESRKLKRPTARKVAKALIVLDRSKNLRPSPTYTPALERIVFLCDPIAYGALPHPRETQGLGILQNLSRMIVTFLFPSAPTIESLCWPAIKADAELRGLSLRLDTYRGRTLPFFGFGFLPNAEVMARTGDRKDGDP